MEKTEELHHCGEESYSNGSFTGHFARAEEKRNGKAKKKAPKQKK
jgi:hypothetical protein